MFRRLLQDLLRFGLVGGLGFLIDVSLFNLLLLTALSHAPLVAKSISVLAAIGATGRAIGGGRSAIDAGRTQDGKLLHSS